MFLDFIKDIAKDDPAMVYLMAYVMDSSKPLREDILPEELELPVKEVKRVIQKGIASGYMNHYKKRKTIYVTKKGKEYVISRRNRWFTHPGYWFGPAKSQ